MQMKKPNYLHIALLILILIISFIPMADARIGVWKNYDKATEKITIRNILHDVVELQLEDNGCGVYLKNGKAQCWADLSGISDHDLDTATLNYYLMNFYNGEGESALGKGLDSWDWNVWYDDIEEYEVDADTLGTCKHKADKENISDYDYDYPCIVGSHKEKRVRNIEVPISLGIDSIPKGKRFHIHLEGEITEPVEWIPTFYGIELSEWAWWDTSYPNDRIACFNTTGGTAYNVLRYVNGTECFDIGDGKTCMLINVPYINSTGYCVRVYYGNNSIAIVNMSNDEQYPADCISGPGTNFSQEEVYEEVDYFLSLPMPENEGTTTSDRTANANTGTLTGNISWVDGYIGKGLRFDPIPANPLGNVSGNLEEVVDTITISFWVKKSGGNLKGSAGTLHIAGGMVSGGQYTDFTVRGDATDVIFMWGAAVATVQYTLDDFYVWNHVVAIHNGTYVSLFVNGVLRAIAADTDTISGKEKYYIGADAVGASDIYNFNGTIDEVQIINDFMTDEWVEAMNSSSLASMGAEESVPNIPPTIVAKTLTPASPLTTDDLVITVNATDSDTGDSTSINISFIDNSTHLVLYSLNQSFTSGVNTTVTLMSANTTFGQEIYSLIDAYDGTDHTIENISSITIPLSIVNTELNWTSPLPIYVNTTANYTFKAWGASDSYNISFELLNGTTSYVTYVVLDLANDTLFSNTTNVLHAGETWNVSINTSHAGTLGENSTVVTIQNTLQEIIVATLSPDPPTLIEDITLTANVTDIDGDILVANTTFFINDLIVYSYSQSITSGVNFSVILGSGNTSGSDVVIGQVNASDDTVDAFGNTSSITVTPTHLDTELNWTALPYYTNSTTNYTYKVYGTCASYNLSVELLNSSVAFESFTLYDYSNDTLFSNTTLAQHAGENWNISISTSCVGLTDINSTNVTIRYTTPENITFISPTPANDTWTMDSTPTINVSATSIDGNESLNCNFYTGITSTALTYNATMKANTEGICNWTLPALSENKYYYYNATVGNGHTNSSATALRRFRIDATAPSHADITPINLSYTNTNFPIAFLNITDTASGVNNNTIELWTSSDGIAWDNRTELTYGGKNGGRKSITDGFQINYTNTPPLIISDGDTLYVNISAKDNANNPMSVVWHFTVDTSAPSSVTLISPADAATITIDKQNFTANATDSIGSPIHNRQSNLSNTTFRIWNNGKVYHEESKQIDVSTESNKSNTTTIEYTFIHEEVYQWNYYFCDNATGGGTEPNCAYGTNRTINYDIPPLIYLLTPDNRTNTTDSTPDFIFNYTDGASNNGNCILYVNGTNVGSNSSVLSGIDTTITSSALIDGLRQKWYVNCSDNSGITNQSEIRMIGIDTTLPVLTIYFPTGEYFTQSLPYYDISLNFSFVENNPESCWYNLNGGEVTGVTDYSYGGSVVSAVNAGDKNIYTEARLDAFGDNITQNFTFLVVPTDLKIRPLFDGCAIIGSTCIDTGRATISCYNSTSDDWDTIVTGRTSNFVDTFPVPSTCLIEDEISISINHSQATGGNLWYNETIFLWNNTLSSCTNTTINMSASGNHSLYLYMNDTFNNIGSSSSELSINLYNVSHSVSNGNVTEGQEVTFSLQINSTNITTTNATFYYNNTAYEFTTRVYSIHQANFTRVLDIPFIISDNESVNYYWNYSINSFSNLTGTRNLTVSKLIVGSCGTLATNVTLRLMMRDETNSSLVNMTLGIVLTYWTDNQLTNRTFNMSIVSNATHDICIYPSFAEYVGNLQMEYESTIYAKRYYYLIETNLTNQTEEIDLYSILISQSTLTTLQVYDQYTSVVEGVIIHFQRYDISTDTFYVVGMAKTSHEGKDIAYFEWYDTLYKFLLFQDNALVLNVDPLKVSSATIEFFIVPETAFHYDIFEDITYALYFNNETKNFVLTFADSSGRIAAGCLKVVNRSLRRDETICDVCEESASATLYCNIGVNATGNYFATFYAKGSDPKIIATISRYFKEIRNLYDRIGNVDGTTLAIMFAGTASFIGLWNPVVGILFMLIGLLGAMSLGFMLIDWVTYLGLCFVGGMIIWKLKT